MPLSVAVAKLAPAVLAAYFLGSIPMGFIIAKQRGIDIRRTGSGNTGATNVYRSLGVALGIIVLAGDALKGVLAALLGRLVFPEAGIGELVCGLAAIIGHNWSVYMRFRGGKGMATSLGVVATAMPVAVLGLLPVWFIIVSVTGYVSLGSITVAALLSVAVRLIYPTRLWHFVFAILAGVLAIWRHRANIRRIIDGTENRLFTRKGR